MFIPNAYDDEMAGLNEEEDEYMNQNEILENLEADTLRLMVVDLWAGMARLESCNASLQQQADRGANCKMKLKIAQEHIGRTRQWQAVEQQKIAKTTAEQIVLAIEMRKFRTEIGGKAQELNTHQMLSNSIFQHLQDEIKTNFML